MSVAGGFPRAVDRARSVGATALQVFVKSARQWRAAPLDPAVVREFRRAVVREELAGHVLAHASYLINLASPHDALWRRSVATLGVEADRCVDLAIPFLVVHPGSHDGSGQERGTARVALALDHVYGRGTRAGRRRAPVTVLLEITAGQGRQLGASFEQLADILAQARCADRLGVCFDTCHALAAGYEFRDGRSYRAMLGHLDRALGVDRVRAFHLNDSKHPIGSHRDRHEHIGRGHVGLEAFRLILNDRRFRDTPMVLETPKGEDLSEDRTNLAVLRGMIGRTRPWAGDRRR